MKNLHELDRHRTQHPFWPQTDSSGTFRVLVGSRSLDAVASVDGDGEHVSITWEPDGPVPDQEELAAVAELFFLPSEDASLQIHYNCLGGHPCSNVHLFRPARQPESDMDTLEERDRRLEQLWADFSDVPMDPGSERMEDSFLHFPRGTHREDIWKWFDARYSLGVAHLLYGNGVDRTDEIAQIYHCRTLCDECESGDCAYNRNGICRFPLVYGRTPNITEDDGCTEFVIRNQFSTE